MRGIPWPVSRNVRPVWVPDGIVSRTRPLSVLTGTSAPSSASARVTGSSRSRSAPRRVYIACGASLTVTTTSRPSGPLPDSRTRLPVSTPARDLHLVALALDVDHALGAVVGLLEGDLGRRLDLGRPAAGRCGAAPPTRPIARRSPPVAAPSRPISAEDVLERRSRPGAPPSGAVRGEAALAGRRAGARRGAEKNIRKKSENPAVAAARRVELVADAAGLPGPAGPAGRPCRAEPGERPARAERIGAARAAAGALELVPVRAQEVVLLALLRVGQDGVGLVDVLEPLLGGLVAGVAVRVMLPGELAEGLLDVGLGGAPRHAQDLVVVPVLHGQAPRRAGERGAVVVDRPVISPSPRTRATVRPWSRRWRAGPAARACARLDRDRDAAVGDREALDDDRRLVGRRERASAGRGTRRPACAARRRPRPPASGRRPAAFGRRRSAALEDLRPSCRPGRA